MLERQLEDTARNEKTLGDILLRLKRAARDPRTAYKTDPIRRRLRRVSDRAGSGDTSDRDRDTLGETGGIGLVGDKI